MKKKKDDDRAPADFQNKPFRSLKAFAATSAPVTPKKTSPQQKVSDDDDPSLFLRATAGAKRLHEEEALPAAQRTEQSGKPAIMPGQDDDGVFLLAMKTFGTSIRSIEHEDEDFDEPRRSASSRMKQLRKGTMRISAELDLHGYLRDEALAHLQRFIANAFSSNRDAVLVITGKGTNSADGPVLPGAVASWLQTRSKGIVAEFHPAPRNLGGSGALVVFLKKNKST